MQNKFRFFVLAICTVLTIGFLSTGVYADKPPCIPSFHDGNIVHFTVVSDNVVGLDRPGINKAAIPLYAFGEPGNQPQFDVLSYIPGQRRYNPWWRVILVIVTSERDVSENPFTSEAELLEAEELGEVLLIDTGFNFLCQVLPSCD